MSNEPNVNDLIAQTSAAIREAFARGFAAGGAAMRDNILKAAGAPLANQPTSLRANDVHLLPPIVTRPTLKQRAPRGSVSALVNRILDEKPGLSTGNLGEAVAALDNRISPSSVSNELRRYESVRYRKEGRGWFLIGNAEKEAAEYTESGPSAAAYPEAAEGGEADRTALAPSGT